MRPVAFDYTAPASLDEAVQALVTNGDEAKIIGGGQSLMPVLRLRMADPGILVDLRKITGLTEIREEGDELVIGAMATHHAVANDALIQTHAGVLSQAALSVGGPQIRYRGTIGGALAHADPAGDIGPAVLALDATMEIAGPNGARTVSASDFFVDLFTTALSEDEVLTAIRVPKHTGWGMHYEKFSQVAQSWAMVAIAAVVRRDGDTVSEARLGMSNMGSTPLRAKAAEAALAGVAADPAAVTQACERASDDTTPPSDASATTEYRQHLARVLTGRAVLAAAGLS